MVEPVFEQLLKTIVKSCTCGSVQSLISLYYTQNTRTCIPGTEAKVKELMLTVLQGEQLTVVYENTEDPSSRVSEVPVSSKKCKLQSHLCFCGPKDNVRMDKMLSE